MDDLEAERLFSALEGRELVRDASRHLAEAGIAVAPMKGALLHALGCADPRARRITDVDLLVPRRDAARAREVLVARGYRVVGRGLAADMLAPPREGALLVDLHHTLYPYQRFGPYADEVFARARRDAALFGVEVRVMDPLDLYAHLVGHFVKDRRDDRQRDALGDLAGVAARFSLSPAEVARHLEAQGLGRAARYTLAFAAAAGDGFADMVRARLTPDPLGDWLAGWARRAVRARRQPAKIAAVPTAFLDRSIVDGCRSLGAQARFAIARTLGGG